MSMTTGRRLTTGQIVGQEELPLSPVSGHDLGRPIIGLLVKVVLSDTEPVERGSVDLGA